MLALHEGLGGYDLVRPAEVALALLRQLIHAAEHAIARLVRLKVAQVRAVGADCKHSGGKQREREGAVLRHVVLLLWNGYYGTQSDEGERAMRIRQRGGIWVVDFKSPDGRRLRVSTGETDKMKAELKAAEVIAERHRVDAHAAASGKLKPVAPKPGSTTFGQAFAHTERHVWEGAKSYRTMKHLIRDLIRDLGHLKLPDVTYSVLAAYCSERSAAGDKPATVNRRMSVASRALREAERLGWILSGPRVPRFREDNLKERYVSPREEAQILAKIYRHCSEDRPEWQYMAALVPFLLDTGLRLGEALSLTMGNWKPSTGASAALVAGEKGVRNAEEFLEGTRKVFAAVPKNKQQPGAVILTHGSTKSGKGRHVPLTPRAEAALLVMLTSDVHGNIRGDGVYHRFMRVAEEAGVKGVTVHTLRHTCASRLVQKGVDLFRVQRWLGHSTPSLTMRYAHLRDDDLADAARLLTG